MASIFSKIVAGEIPSYKIAENKHFYAFLDINPLAKGHTLVIPKKETDYIFDIEDTPLGEMMIFAKKVGSSIEKNIPCKRIGIAVLGLEVPHAHIHLIPINSLYDIDFKQPKLKLEASEFEEIATKIRATFEKDLNK
jgi:histidine triad (HIT) family protein